MRDKKYPYIGRHVEDWDMEDVQAEDFELEQRNMVTKANREIKGNGGVVNLGGCGFMFFGDGVHLVRPKTSGEELLDELSQYLDNSYSNTADIEADKSAFKDFAVDLIAKYNITKKEQGND